MMPPSGASTGRTLERPPLLFVGNFLSGDVTTRQVGQELTIRLVDRGWTVRTTSSRLNRPQRIADMMWTCFRQRAQYSAAHVELYSGHAFVWAEASCSVLRKVGRPYVLALHGGGLPDYLERHPARVSRLITGAAAVVAPSSYLADVFRPFRHDIQVLPNAIDLKRYIFRQRERCEPKLVWLRAFQSTYDPTMAVEVLASLRTEFPNIQLTMVGPDKKDGTLERVRALGKKLGLNGNLRIRGPVPKAEVPTVMAEADVMISTSRADNSPVSLVEAMACGLCVVTTNVGGVPRLCTDGKDALLVDQGDVSAMAGRVRSVLTDSALARKLSEGGRRNAESRDWGTVLPQWEQLFERIQARSANG